MITTHLHWSSDLSKAPRGEKVTTKNTVMIKGEPVERERVDFIPTRVLTLSKCGKIIPTYWIPGRPGTLEGDRWSGYNRGEQPLLWAPWPDAAELMKTYQVTKAVDAAMGEEDE